MIIKNKKYALEFFVGLLNCFLLDVIFQTFNSTNHLPARELKRLPIAEIDFSDETKVRIYDEFINLVKVQEKNFEIVKTTKGSTTDHIQAQIVKTDKEIDALVYKMYNLTNVDIKIIEGTIK
jgi:hypothetical protein